MAKEEAIQVQGKVTQALANTQFRVRLENGRQTANTSIRSERRKARRLRARSRWNDHRVYAAS